MNDGVKEAAFLVRAHPDLSSWGGGQSPAARVTVRQRWREVSALVFGFSPKISTPVEKTVENRVLWSSSPSKLPFSGLLLEAKPTDPPGSALLWQVATVFGATIDVPRGESRILLRNS